MREHFAPVRGCETMAAVNAHRNRFIVCRQCLKIRGDTLPAGYPWSVDSRFPFITRFRADREKKRKKKRKTRAPVNRIAFGHMEIVPSGVPYLARALSSLFFFFCIFNQQEDEAIESTQRLLWILLPIS